MRNDYHNLNLVSEKHRKIIEILLSWEERLSDGYEFYCEHGHLEDDMLRYNNDVVLLTLSEIAEEILNLK
jgi:hypothetical protein